MATETWVLNETFGYLTTQTFTVNFTSNGQNYDKIDIYAPKPIQQEIRYGDSSEFVWDVQGGWTNEAYRTVVLDSPATGDLLTWLQANGTKQVASRLSVDLTTLSGWVNLSAGEKNITIVAKAEGFKDSAPSASVKVTKAAAMPVKGDIITLDSKQYRVLKTEGTVAEVLAMYDASTSQKFGSTETYANGSLDTYCNTTFYNSLSSTMQTAIVANTFQQDSWYYSDGTSGGQGNPTYQATFQTTNNYRLGLGSATFGSSISRKCYVLSVQDIINYLGVTTSMTNANTTLTSENVWKLFWNQTSKPSTSNLWLRSASADTSYYDFAVDPSRGYIVYRSMDSSYAVRPAFQIDLSKISWS